MSLLLLNSHYPLVRSNNEVCSRDKVWTVAGIPSRRKRTPPSLSQARRDNPNHSPSNEEELAVVGTVVLVWGIDNFFDIPLFSLSSCQTARQYLRTNSIRLLLNKYNLEGKSCRKLKFYAES